MVQLFCFSRRQPPLQRIRREQASEDRNSQRHQHPEQRPLAQIGRFQAVTLRFALGRRESGSVLRLQRRRRPIRDRGRPALQDPPHFRQEHVQLSPFRNPGDDS